MKVRFNFEPINTLVDVFMNGYKVREKHNGNHGHIYLYGNEKSEVEIKPHDPRVPIQAVFTPEGKIVILEKQPVAEVQPLKAILETQPRGDFV